MIPGKDREKRAREQRPPDGQRGKEGIKSVDPVMGETVKQEKNGEQDRTEEWSSCS